MVTKWGGLAFTNTPLTPERTVGLCWRIWGWLHAVHPPSLAGFALGAVSHPPLLCTDRKAQLQPAPCHGNNLPPAASISRAAFYCLINMHYAQPIKARAACSSLLYSSENTELTGTAPHCQEGCWGGWAVGCRMLQHRCALTSTPLQERVWVPVPGCFPGEWQPVPLARARLLLGNSPQRWGEPRQARARRPGPPPALRNPRPLPPPNALTHFGWWGTRAAHPGGCSSCHPHLAWGRCWWQCQPLRTPRFSPKSSELARGHGHAAALVQPAA